MKKAICSKAAIFTLGVFLAIFSTTKLAVAQESGGLAPKDARARWGATFLVWQAVTIGGSTFVDEHGVRSNQFSLADDLGVNSITSLGLQAFYKMRGGTSFHLTFEKPLFRGSNTLPTDEYYNGSLMSGGSSTDASKTGFYRFRFFVQFKGWNFGDSTRFAPIVGLTYDRLHYHVDGKIDPLSSSSEPSENFASQALPLPFVGFRFERDVARSWQAYATAWGTYLPPVLTPYVEGGRVTVMLAMYDASVGMKWIGNHLSVSLEYLLRYFEMHEQSHEDDNYFRLFATGPQLSITYSF